jgi:hypothetical protein
MNLIALSKPWDQTLPVFAKSAFQIIRYSRIQIV